MKELELAGLVWLEWDGISFDEAACLSLLLNPDRNTPLEFVAELVGLLLHRVGNDLSQHRRELEAMAKICMKKKRNK